MRRQAHTPQLNPVLRLIQKRVLQQEDGSFWDQAFRHHLQVLNGITLGSIA